MSQFTPASRSLSTIFLTRLQTLARAATLQQRVAIRLVALTMGLLLVSGRTMLTRVLIALGLDWHDWTAAYRLFSQGRVDLAVLRRGVLDDWLALYGPHDPIGVVLDGTQLPRTSKKLPGVGFLRAPRTPPWRPGIHYAQRWEGLSGLTPITAAGDTRAIPLWFEPAPTPKATAWPDIPPRTEWEAGRDALIWLRTELDRQGQTTRRIVAVADGAYTGADLWNALPDHVTLIARCAKNRALFALPPVPTGRGRPRKYGERAPTPQAQRAETGDWQEIVCQVRGRARHLRVKVTGPWLVQRASTHPLFLIIVAGIDRQHGARRVQRDPTYLLVSAVETADGDWVLPDPLATVVGWAWQRWEVEVMHRELKSGWGLGDQQQWHPASAALAPQWVVWTYALLLLAAIAGPAPELAPPAAKWYRGRRWTPRDLLTGVRQEVWQSSLADFLALPPGSGANPVKKPPGPAPPLAWLRIAHAI